MGFIFIDLTFVLIMSRYRIILLLCVAVTMLSLFSCGKRNYNNDDIYDKPSKHTTSSVTHSSRADEKGDEYKAWKRLDIKLGKEDNKELYNEIKEWLGTPYKYACETKGVSTDCSGFVMKVYLAVYKKPIERNSSRIYEKNCKPISRNKLKEGDLVFFHGKNAGRITHVGIYLKDGYFAHASSSQGVTVNSLTQNYYNTHFECAGRVK